MGVALAVIVGGVIAASARTARTAVLGLVLTWLAAPLLADPPGAPLGLAARVVAAVLAGYLLWIAARGVHLRTEGSRIGWPSEAFVGIAAAVVGYGTHGVASPADGPPTAAAAGFALMALAVAPVIRGRDVLRIGLGLGLLLGGALLIRTSLGGTAGAFEDLVKAGGVATLGGVIATLASAARSDGHAWFDLGRGSVQRSSHAVDQTARTGR
jgi:hypothetical protein